MPLSTEELTGLTVLTRLLAPFRNLLRCEDRPWAPSSRPSSCLLVGLKDTEFQDRKATPKSSGEGPVLRESKTHGMHLPLREMAPGPACPNLSPEGGRGAILQEFALPDSKWFQVTQNTDPPVRKIPLPPGPPLAHSCLSGAQSPEGLKHGGCFRLMTGRRRK
jgi:hypothetical protein